MAGNTVLAKMAVQIAANTAEFNRALNATQKNLSSFTSGITKIAGTLGVAFGVQQVASFALEVSKLAGEAEGVRAAFERLPNSTKLMEDLKRATGNTVSELDLMKRAVQASNFDISLSALPRLLEFATLRAQQTGQSVDYLVDSIVTGIGRKSKLILDNLGISAVQLNEALGGASTAAASIGDVADAVGKIAEDNLKNMAGFSDNASTKLQKLAASWENVKVAIGDAANSTGFLGGSIDALTGSLDLLASRDLTALEKIAALFGGPGSAAAAAIEDYNRKLERINKEQEKQAQIIREVDRYFKEFNGDIDAYGKTITTHIYRTELLAEFTKRLNKERQNETVTLEGLKAKLDELNSTFAQTDTNDKAKLRNIGDEIRATEALISELEALKIARISATSQRAIADQNPLRQTQGIGLDKVVGDLGVNNVADQIELAASRIDSALINNELSIESWAESMRIHARLAAEEQDRITETFHRNAAAAQSFGDTIGQAFAEASSGQKSWAQSLQSTIPRIVGLLASEAIASIIVAGSKQGAKSGNAIIGVAAAAAGAAAISALIRNNLSGGNGGSSGSVARSSSSGNSTGSVGRSDVQDNKIIAETILRGQDIYVVLKNYEQSKKLTSSISG